MDPDLIEGGPDHIWWHIHRNLCGERSGQPRKPMVHLKKDPFWINCMRAHDEILP